MSLDIMYHNIKPFEQRHRYLLKFILCLFISLILLVVMIYANLRFDYGDKIVYGDGSIVNDWEYVTGYNLVNVNRSSEFKKIGSLSEVVPNYEDVYIRLIKTLPTSDEIRYLHIQTYYNQLEVKINGEKVYDSFDITSEFGSSMNITLEIPANVVDPNIDIILRFSLLPKINVFLFNNTANQFGITLNIAVSTVLLILTFIFSFISITKGLLSNTKHSKTILLGIGISGVLFFFSFLFYGLMLFTALDSLLLLRLWFLFGMLATLPILYTAISLSGIEYEKKQAFLTIEVLYITVFAVAYRSDLFFFMIRNFGWVIFGLFFAVLLSYLKSHPENGKGWVHFLTFAVLVFSVLTFWMVISLGLAFLLAPVLLIGLLAYNVFSYYHVGKKKQNEFESGIGKGRYNFLDFNYKNIGAVGDLLEVFLRDPDNFSHAYKVSQYVYLICLHSGMMPEVCETVAKAALLHDIGKLKVPHKILKKEETLNSDEYELMKMHSYYGYQILSSDKSEFMQIAAIIAKQHHERFDGKGYYGLKGNQIHPYAQITGIADVFDAIASDRGYKKAWSFEEGFEYIIEHAGVYFSQQYVDAFIKAKEGIRWICENTKTGAMSREVI